MKIAFVGASGYGNVGDDVYPLVFRQQLPDHELLFYNSDRPDSLPSDISMLVMGGGGLIYNSDRQQLQGHVEYMTYYLDAAKEMGIPWGFVSCGLQLTLDKEKGVYHTDVLQPWLPYLRKANFVSLRSRTCVEIVRRLTGIENATFFPDVSYLFDPIDARRVKRQRVVTFIPSGATNPKGPRTQHIIEPFLSVGYELIVISMGAACDDQRHLEAARRRYPEATIVEDPTPRDVLAAIARSSFVVTGRYHGMIFARLAGVPFYRTFDITPYKIREEDLRCDPRRAIGHIDLIRSWQR